MCVGVRVRDVKVCQCVRVRVHAHAHLRTCTSTSTFVFFVKASIETSEPCHDARKHMREEEGGESVGATFLDLAGEDYW